MRTGTDGRDCSVTTVCQTEEPASSFSFACCTVRGDTPISSSRPHLHHHLSSPRQVMTHRDYVPPQCKCSPWLSFCKGKEIPLTTNFVPRINKWFQADLSLHRLLMQGVPKTASKRRMFASMSKLTHLILLTTVQKSSTLRMAHLTPKNTCSAVAELFRGMARLDVPPNPKMEPHTYGTNEPRLCPALGHAKEGATLPRQVWGAGWWCPQSDGTALAHHSLWCPGGSPGGWK